MTGFAAGAALLLGLLLASAGVLKLARPRAFQHALYRLLPARYDSVLLVRVAAWAVGVAEVVVGGCLLAVPWASNRFDVAPAAASVALYSAFVGIIAIAVRKGIACGCYSSLSDSVAGGAELGRSVALAATACALFAVELLARPAGWRWTALAWVAGLVAVVVAVALVGGRLRPELERPARAPALSPPVAENGAARTGRFAGLLVGRVKSNNASRPLRGLALRRRQQVVIARAVRSSQSWATVAEWLGDRAAGVSWSSAFAREEHVSEDPNGRSGYYTLAPIRARGLSLVATVRFEGGDFFECLLLGTVDGIAVRANGPVVTSGDKTVFVSREAAASPTT